MIWADKAKLARGIAVTVLATALAGTAIAGPVVVRSTGPSARAYPAGRQLADTAQLSLRAGDTLVLLDARGTRTVSGPGTFPAVAVGTRARASQAAARILSTQNTSERRGGAVRGGAAANDARSPNLWFVDMSKSGTMCVADPATVRVWRAVSAKPAEARITGAGVTGAIVLPQGASVADWPKALPVSDGAEYMVAIDGVAPARIKFATVPMPTGLEDTAAKLIAKGCQTQLDLLIATTASSGGSG